MDDARPHSLTWHLMKRLLLMQGVMLVVCITLVIGTLACTGLLRAVDAPGAVLARVVFPDVLLIAFAMFLITHFVVRRAHIGLANVAAEAARIDINERGARLRLDGVPREVTPLVNAINTALAQLDIGYNSHKRFLLDAARELTMPIAVLQTRLESLPPGAADVRLLEGVAHLAILAEQLLDLQRLSHASAQFAAVDLLALSRRVASQLAPMAVSAGYALSLEPNTNRARVNGDERALERAMINLVQNAIQHGGRKGTITIRVANPASISVEDEGRGIPPGQRNLIFEPFYRLRGRGRGAGRGLNLVREAVQLHGGKVIVTQAPGGGACFTIKFASASVIS
ncbi:HAMP domain-containing histidine kinase [Phyllobacterium sp. 628]|uniref:sensor histidine kinase n=1 Tax=Phyllobacterium sp. 628 TaxID=2718938 RepID=UPI0016623009|nr:HAMP domain-containing sensor histidine kinase [Phyllobacterium sp. 628]QND52141.1 HAMP domain-containing histidine kinase [Phyllobacterium sp. 628]